MASVRTSSNNHRIGSGREPRFCWRSNQMNISTQPNFRPLIARERTALRIGLVVKGVHSLDAVSDKFDQINFRLMCMLSYILSSDRNESLEISRHMHKKWLIYCRNFDLIEWTSGHHVYNIIQRLNCEMKNVFWILDDNLQQCESQRRRSKVQGSRFSSYNVSLTWRYQSRGNPDKKLSGKCGSIIHHVFVYKCSLQQHTAGENWRQWKLTPVKIDASE